ncbi:PrsW family intramembrane metalloprotease [Nonomuraea sp. NPDC000554]|uniref:PrsW family intramembrane metalloprotease n=1 Tax=Nonomuraea sp. NPDC000554 TaxID=3154259 RepID=UPI0033349D64
MEDERADDRQGPGPDQAAPIVTHCPPCREPGPAPGLITTMVISACFALLAIGYQLSWLIAQNDGTPAEFAADLAVAVGLALAPLPAVFAAVTLLQRCVPTPWVFQALVFAWGAGIAVFVSVAVESWVSADLQVYFGVDEAAAERVSGLYVAPPVEEALKGVALWRLLSHCRHAIAAISYGILYASMTGVGFAAVENVLYYLIPVIRTGADHGLAAATTRAPVVLLMHPLWTAVIGLGVGCALATAGRARFLPVVLGYGGATLLHFLWNRTIDNAPTVDAGTGLWSQVSAWMAERGGLYLPELAVVGILIGVMVRERRRPPF